MNGFIQWSEKNIVPVAGKIGSQRHLVSIRDAFIAMLPLTLAGSLAVLLNVFLRDIPTSLGMDGFVENMQWLIAINGNVWWATLAMMALVFSFTLAYNLGKNGGVDALPAGVVGLMIFIGTTTPYAVKVNGADASALLGGNLAATGLFTAMIFILVIMELYVFIIKRNITIKMPDSVPPAVSKAFTAVIPGVVAVYLSVILSDTILQMSGMPVNDLITEMIQKPLLNLSQGLPAVLIITFFTQVLWFFGLHGMNILGPIYESIWGVAQVQNISDVQAGLEPTYMWVRASFDVYSMMGGSGMTIGLVIGMFMLGKREDTRTIAKIGGAPGLFNINEPLVFGVPIVLNPVYLIPWVIVPLITVTIGYVMTAIGFAGPVITAVPWVTPGVLSAFLATGANLGATVTALICLIVSIVIWAPFVVLAEKEAEKEEQARKNNQ